MQLFSDSRQDLADSGNWTLTNLTESLPVSYSNTPIESSPSSRFTLTSSASYSSNIVSSFTLNSSSDFNDSRSTACFSTHVYQGSVFIESFEIGVIYDGVEYYSQYIFESDVGWHKIFHTFDLPSNKNLTNGVLTGPTVIPESMARIAGPALVLRATTLRPTSTVWLVTIVCVPRTVRLP